ncbi:MAG: response regulator transcription factor [Candidatus Gastranaerophilales bacterium]|nr:response regulator transcription factor [Candidatus Gastranaerophilales bacterium]
MNSTLAKILIIDDNAKLLQDALPMYGYEVSVAQDGLCGLKILDENSNFDLILLDVVMPNFDGWETLKAIRQNPKISKIPIIMLTSVSDANKQISGLKFGADDYIVKPFVLPNLLARIEALLRRSTWNKEEKHVKALPFVKEGKISPLTQREKEILSLVAKGETNSKIAEKLFVREVTVKTHLNSIFRKLNVANRTQAVLLAQQTEII